MWDAWTLWIIIIWCLMAHTDLIAGHMVVTADWRSTGRIHTLLPKKQSFQKKNCTVQVNKQGGSPYLLPYVFGGDILYLTEVLRGGRIISIPSTNTVQPQ
jgi:hypothetical protein